MRKRTVPHPLPLRLRAWLLSALTFSSPGWAAPGDDPLVSDRPGLVESSTVVGRGRVQVEVGYAMARDKSGGVDADLATTPTLLRFGLGDAWELRIETDGYARLETDDRTTGSRERTSGMSDVSLGVKWHLQDGGDSWKQPALGLLASLDFDTGSAAFRGAGTRPALSLVAEWELPHDWSLGVMPGVLWDENEDGDRYAAGVLGFTLGQRWTPRLSTFLEVAGYQLAPEKNGGNQVAWGGGITYLLTDDVQVDAACGWGTTRHTPDFIWGVGLSVRF